jgi:hypothetical protein
MYFRGSGKAAEMKREAATRTMMAALWQCSTGQKRYSWMELEDYASCPLFPFIHNASCFIINLVHVFIFKYNSQTKELDRLENWIGSTSRL